MTPKFSLQGLYRDGWSIFVPATSTTAFINFLRSKTAFAVDIGAFARTPMGQPAQDLFVLPDKFTEQQVKDFITTFGAELA